jgi:hypothetical protein
MQSSILPRGHNYREQTYEFNDEEHIFAMLLILVLALLFCPSLAEEELRGVKKKKMLIRPRHTIWKDETLTIQNKCIYINSFIFILN